MRLTGERLASLQHLLYISYHDPLHILQLCVDAAQVPSRSAVDVRLLCFLDVCVWRGRKKLKWEKRSCLNGSWKCVSENLSSTQKFRR